MSLKIPPWAGNKNTTMPADAKSQGAETSVEIWQTPLPYLPLPILSLDLVSHIPALFSSVSLALTHPKDAVTPPAYGRRDAHGGREAVSEPRP